MPCDFIPFSAVVLPPVKAVGYFARSFCKLSVPDGVNISRRPRLPVPRPEQEEAAGGTESAV